MVAEASLVDLAHQVGQVLAHNIPGDFVEVGFDVTLSYLPSQRSGVRLLLPQI
jgi:hypothetical protein